MASADKCKKFDFMMWAGEWYMCSRLMSKEEEILLTEKQFLQQNIVKGLFF